MAVSYIWPAGLPQLVTPQFSESSGALILRTPMDAGPAKMRRRGARPDVLNCAFRMSTAQLTTLATFVNTTLRGTARFGFPHPRTQTQVEVRIVPQQDGALYSDSYLAPNLWSVTLALEVLP